MSNMACGLFIKIPFGETSARGQGSPVGSSPWWLWCPELQWHFQNSDLAALSIGCPHIWQESQCPEPCALAAGQGLCDGLPWGMN